MMESFDKVNGVSVNNHKKCGGKCKIWDVGNFVAVYFINQTDANTEPRGIDAAYEP